MSKDWQPFKHRQMSKFKSKRQQHPWHHHPSCLPKNSKYNCKKDPFNSRSSSSGSSSQSSSSLSPQPSCLLEATTSSQRTKTVLNLEYQNPTLSIVHALDERYVLLLSSKQILHSYKIICTLTNKQQQQQHSLSSFLKT
eukprot:scaffold4335_cov119-Cylindrotheca_fusiformis.AAC.12